MPYAVMIIIFEIGIINPYAGAILLFLIAVGVCFV